MDPAIQHLVDTTAAKYGVPVNLARALVMQESGGNPQARSPVGALGVMQLMPGTAKGLGVQNPLDPVQNVEGGMKMLAGLLHEFKDPKLALAAYNAGSGAVRKYGGVPPYAETQNYVKAIMANAAQMGPVDAAWGTPGGNRPTPGTPPPPVSPAGAGSNLPQDLFDQSAPSSTTVGLLQKLGGTSGEVAKRAQESIPLPQNIVGPGAKTTSLGGEEKPAPYEIGPHVKAQGLAGDVPMVLGGPNQFTNLHFAGHVDFQHVNHRLLDIINKEATKMGKVVTIISGYRSNDYSAKNGGFKGDPHTKGLAVDAYINGHPIGDVIPPEVWAKYGVRSGNTPGFYNGKPDPEHLDLVGVPVKQVKS